MSQKHPEREVTSSLRCDRPTQGDGVMSYPCTLPRGHETSTSDPADPQPCYVVESGRAVRAWQAWRQREDDREAGITPLAKSQTVIDCPRCHETAMLVSDGEGECQECGQRAKIQPTLPEPVDEQGESQPEISGIPFSSNDEGIDFPLRARRLVQEQINVSGIGTRRGDPIDPIALADIYVVWFAYVLGNWKAIISTSRPDARIWEVTYSSTKGEAYVDSYLKTHNVRVPQAYRGDREGEG